MYMLCQNDGLLCCYDAVMMSTGMHPVLLVVHLREKGSSHRPEPVLWRRDRLHLTSGAGLNYTRCNASSWTQSVDLLNTVCCVKQLYKQFQVPGPPKGMGRGKEWNVDLVPKFMLSNGETTLMQTFPKIIPSRNPDCSQPCLRVYVRGAVTCYRAAGEDADVYRGDAVLGLQSHRGQLRVQRWKSSQSSHHRGRRPRLRWHATHIHVILHVFGSARNSDVSRKPLEYPFTF